MEELMSRSIKSIIFFVIMYLSLRYLGFANGAAVTASLIPLVLGVVNVMTGTAYSIAAFVFVLAALSVLLPPKYRNAVDCVETVWNKVSLERAPRSVATDKNIPTSVETPAKQSK